MAGSSDTPKDDENKDDVAENGKSEEVEATDTDASEDAESSEETVSDVDEGVVDAVVASNKEAVDSAAENDVDGTEVVDREEELTDTVPATVPTAPEPASAGASVFSLIFGGLVAGGLGFLIATYAVPIQTLPTVAEVPDLSEDLAEQTARVDALLDEFEAFRNAPVPEAGEPMDVDLSPITSRQDETDATVAEVGSVLATIEESLGALDSRLSAIESEPRTLTPDGSGAMEAQLEAFRAELDAVTEDAKTEIEAAKARASEIEAAAAETAAKADREAALAELRAALESGAPYSDILDRLPDVPDELAEHGDEGVRPLSDLQQAYPEVARQTLQTAESVAADDAPTSRFTAFLRKQTNARSLAPREGDDTDAVLSRGEAALDNGDLATAIAELDGLQGEVPEEMAAWIADARARLDAVDAAATLSADATN